MRALIAGAMLTASAVAGAANPAAPAGCPIASNPQQHQFDFWIGKWEVTGAGGKIAGHSRIEPVSGGCGISERWEGAGGSSGVSYNAWDPSTARWHQFWIGNSAGDVLYLEGGLDAGTMTMQGVRNNAASGKPQRQRISWTPNPDGTVRQLWDTSDDDGKTWTVAFDGLYRKRAK